MYIGTVHLVKDSNKNERLCDGRIYFPPTTEKVIMCEQCKLITIGQAESTKSVFAEN